MEITRDIFNDLKAWKDSKRRKPLVMQGARQSLRRQFGDSIFYWTSDNTAEVEFVFIRPYIERFFGVLLQIFIRFFVVTIIINTYIPIASYDKDLGIFLHFQKKDLGIFLYFQKKDLGIFLHFQEKDLGISDFLCIFAPEFQYVTVI